MSYTNTSIIRRFMAATLIALLVTGKLPASANFRPEFFAPSEIVSLAGSKKVVKTSEAVEDSKNIDFVSLSTTGIDGNQMTLEELQETIKSKGGSFIGDAIGMPYDEYVEAMTAEWVDCTKYNKKPTRVTLDIERSYTYYSLVSKMKNLSKYEGVWCYSIGESVEGRKIYALDIDIKSDEEKQLIVLTGNVHARETAGTMYIIKTLADLIQSKDKNDKALLAKYHIVAVPCVNPDGREGVAFDTENYTYSDGQLWKATSNGTDLNRNFPGLSWCQVKNTSDKTEYRSYSSKKLYYLGDYAGSCPETKALMKFLYYFIVVKQARILIDYHQQGAISYAGKPWDKSEHQKACKSLAKTMFSYMNKGNDHDYYWVEETSTYGLEGTGSTLTDYACSIAYGAKFSPTYGFCVYTDGKNEYPLIDIPKMDKCDKKLIDEPNPEFATMTFEIGYGRQYLGYSAKTRKLLATEYTKYRFGNVIEYLDKYLTED